MEDFNVKKSHKIRRRHMSDKKSQDIALFRYRIIAPVLNDSGRGQRRYFRRKSEEEFDVPHMGKKRYKSATFKSWLLSYRNGGFDALRQIRSTWGTVRSRMGIPRPAPTARPACANFDSVRE